MCRKNGCLNRTGDKPLRSIGKAATSVLPPLTPLSFSSKMNMPLTQVALVARPCAPVAQRVEDSSSSRSRLAKSYGRFAPLYLRQDCFFRVFLPKQHSSYSPSAADKLISSTHSFTEKLRSDSFQKLRMLRTRFNLKSSLHSALQRPMSPLRGALIINFSHIPGTSPLEPNT